MAPASGLPGEGGASLSDDRVLLAAEGGFAWLGPDGEVAPADALAGLDPAGVRALASREGRVTALMDGPDGVLGLWHLAPGAPLEIMAFEDPPGTPSALAALGPPETFADAGRGRWFVAREEGGRVALDVVEQGPGEAGGSATRLLETVWRASPELVWLGEAGGLWLRGTESGGYRLDRVVWPGAAGAAATLVNVARTSDPLHGPVLSVGPDGAHAVFVVIGGVLQRLSGDAPTPLVAPGTPRLFCLRSAPAPLGLLACDATDLLRLDPETGAAAPFLALADLQPPSLAGLDATARFACNLDWTDAASDAGLPTEPPPAASATPSGCHGAAAPPSLLAVLFLAWRATRQARPRGG